MCMLEMAQSKTAMRNVSKASMQRGESLVAIYNTMNVIKHLRKKKKTKREREREHKE